MAHDVTGLPAYTKQDSNKIIFKMVEMAQTAEIISKAGNVQTGIKSAESINIIVNDPTFQVDVCGFNPSGDDVLTQRIITVGKIKINQEFCDKDLESKFTQGRLKIGSKYDTLALKNEIAADVSQRIAKKNEIAIWQGDLASGNANLNKFDGFIKIIDALTNEIIPASSGTLT